MAGILRDILYNRALFRDHRKVIKATALLFISKLNEGEYQEGQFIDKVIGAIVEDKLSGPLFQKRVTRQTTKYKKKIQEKTAQIRLLRLKEEAHLGYSFPSDVSRTMNELKFVLQMK